MYPALLALLLYSSLTTGGAVKVSRVNVPNIVDPRKEEVVLRCEYDLDGEELYSVAWIKDGAEFFKFTTSGPDSVLAFPVDGVAVDIARSNAERVTLLGETNSFGAKVNLTGEYGCEVTTEAPTFLQDYKSARMYVAIEPKIRPVLEGLRPHYEIGDILNVTCTSGPSHPPTVLVFLLNGKEVNSALTRDEGRLMENVMSTSRLGISLRLTRQHFPGGNMRLVCRSMMPEIPVAKTLETEGIATLAASNQRLAQEPPKSNSTGFYVSSPIAVSLLLMLHLIRRNDDYFPSF